MTRCLEWHSTFTVSETVGKDELLAMEALPASGIGCLHLMSALEGAEEVMLSSFAVSTVADASKDEVQRMGCWLSEIEQ